MNKDGMILFRLMEIQVKVETRLDIKRDQKVGVLQTVSRVHEAQQAKSGTKL